MVKPIKKQKQSKATFNDNIRTLYKTYTHTLLVHSQLFRTSSIHTLRDTLRATSKVLFGKHKHLIRALESVNPKMKELTSKFTSNCFLIFTNDGDLPPKIESMQIEDFIRAGDTLKERVVLKKGVLDIDIKGLEVHLRSMNVLCSLRDGKVFVEEDYVIDDVVNSNDAKILKVLGMKDVTMKMKVIGGFENN